MPITNTVKTTVTINGKSISFTEWEISLGSYGSLSKCSIKTSKSKIKKEGVDLIALSQQATLPNIVISVSVGDQQNRKVFSGMLDDTDFDLDADCVEIHCIDNAAPLLDTKKTLAGFNLTNQTADQFVRQIARSFGFGTGKIQAPNPNPLLGVVFNRQSTWSPHPQPIWNILQTLAREAGFECRVTPDNDLYFGPQSDELAAGITCSWKKTPANTDLKSLPIKNFHIKHQPRRNKTFVVIVASHHRKTGQVYTGQAVFNGMPATSATGAIVGQNSTVKAGLYTGSAGASVRNLLSGSLNGKPVYIINKDGLTQDACQALATAKGKDIAKRELIITATIDGLPSLQPNTPVTVIDYTDDGELDGFELQGMIIAAVTHRYKMPQGGSGEGYTTEFTAMNVPPIEQPLGQ